MFSVDSSEPADSSSLHAEGQSDILTRDVTAAEADGDGPVKAVERAEDCLIEQLGRGAWGNAIEHLAEDDAGDSVELACRAQLPQHAVNLVRLGAHVFNKEQLAFSTRLPRCAQQRNENAETAAVERASRCARLECAQAFGGADGCRAGRRWRRESSACERRLQDRNLQPALARERPEGRVHQAGAIERPSDRCRRRMALGTLRFY